MLGGCNRPHQTDTPVFIISIDTLRSDHLAVYGYRGGSTPNIDAFRRDAVLFQHAYSHCPLTLPSHATIMTGLLPPASGVRDNIGYTLSPSLPTLASVLKGAGYVTGGAVSAYVLRRATGIDHGFDFFDDEVEYVPDERGTRAERDGAQTLAALERWMAGAKSKKLFGFLHLYEPHKSYAPPPGFRLPNPYDGEIAYADSIVGNFLAELKRRDLYDRSLIVFLSDHGEGLGDHGEDEHGILLYREAIQVPLLVKLPHQDRRGDSIDAPVGLVDVMPTILKVAGVKAPSRLDGSDLLKVTGRRAIYGETYFPRLHFGWHELFSEIDGNSHYIDAPGPELYDVARDLAERSNLASNDRRVVSAMRGELRAHPAQFGEPSSVDPEDQRKLAALGYIGSSSGASGPLPDPKDKLPTLEPFKRAIVAFDRGDDPTTIALLEQFVVSNPSLVDAWGLLAQSYRRSGHPERAIAVLRTAMNRFPGNALVALALADLYLTAGDLDQAAAHAEIAVAQSPVLAREILTRIALQRKNGAEASRQIELALREAPTRTTTLLLAAKVAEDGGDFGHDLALLDSAAAQIELKHLPPAERLQFARGIALLHLERGADAEAAFRREVAAFPKNIEAWGNLIVVVGVGARHDEAKSLAADAVRINPDAKGRKTVSEALDVIGEKEAAAGIR
jgi:choline-sulfatase